MVKSILKINAIVIFVVGLLFIIQTSYIYKTGIDFAKEHEVDYKIGTFYEGTRGNYFGIANVKYPSLFKYYDKLTQEEKLKTDDQFLNDYNNMNEKLYQIKQALSFFFIAISIIVFIGFFIKVKKHVKSMCDKMQILAYILSIISIISINFYFAYLPITASIFGVILLASPFVLLKKCKV